MTEKVFIVFNQDDLLYENGIDTKKNLSSFNNDIEAKNYIEKMKKGSPKTVYELLEYERIDTTKKFTFIKQLSV